MTKKKEKEYNDHIRELNRLILEYQDAVNTLAKDRNKWRAMCEMLVIKYDLPDNVKPDKDTGVKQSNA